MSVSLIGSGVFAQAIAYLLIKANQTTITMWSEKKDVSLTHKIQNKVLVTTDLNEALTNDIIVVLVANKYIKDILLKIPNDKTILIGSKGLLPNILFYEDLLNRPIIYFAGATLAKDLLDDKPLSLCFSTIDQALINNLFKDTIHKTFLNDSRILQLASALKNAYAIGSGLIEKPQYLVKAYEEAIYLNKTINHLDNTTVALLLNNQDILDDFVMTCSIRESRNMTYGRLLTNANAANNYLNTHTVEGIETIKNIIPVIQSLNLQAPIITTIYNIIYKEANISTLKEIIR